MPGNRRRNANTVPLLSMAAWIVVCLYFGGAGLGYVAMKSRLHAAGREIKELEKEKELLTSQNVVCKTNIAKLSSTDALDQRFKSDKTHLNGLIKIPSDKLVNVDDPQRRVESVDGFRQVANREPVHQ